MKYVFRNYFPFHKAFYKMLKFEMGKTLKKPIEKRILNLSGSVNIILENILLL